MKRNFWTGKNVLITGYEGFLGSHLTKKLINFKANVIGLDIKTFRKETILQKSDLQKIKVIKGSVFNKKLVDDIIVKYCPQFVFHLAAQATIGSCFVEPIKAFNSNIRGTWILLEALRNNSLLEGIVVASSDKAYGPKKNLPYKETDSLSPTHPYDTSKSCADLLSKCYFHSYNLPVSITRCGNIYGPGDFNFSRIIPDIILSALKNKTLLIRSNGKFTRDYIYVDDIVDGYLRLAEKMKEKKLYGEAFNFSNERPISVVFLVSKIFEILTKKLDYKILNQARHEIENQFLCSEKASKTLGWKPEFSLDRGLEATIKWYKNLE